MMMTSGTGKNYSSSWACFRSVVRNEGYVSCAKLARTFCAVWLCSVLPVWTLPPVLHQVP
eukprot:gene6181-4459_t